MAARSETPDTVHGRLLESVHLSGYSFERACGELEWLLEKDRWRSVGGGFKDIDKFLDTIDFSEYRIALAQRHKLVKRLASLRAGQRATGRLLGVSAETVARDSGARPATNVAKHGSSSQQGKDADATNVAPDAWFQADADPSREAKRVTRNLERDNERGAIRDARPSRAMPAGQFSLIYADPPWQYEHPISDSRVIENQYPTLTLDQICALEIPAADDAVLFLWTTSPLLRSGLRVVDAWGFNYRTCAVWDKELIGMGYYFRQQHELLLVAARGASVLPPSTARPSSVLRARRGKHSEKPAFVYDLLEMMYPQFTEADRVELFAREGRSGWTAWSNEPEMAVQR